MNNYMKTIISGLKQWVSSQKSDWNQNDSSAVNFIKNRPFYSEEKEKVLFSSDSLSSRQFTLSHPLIKGNTYTVIFNGTTYQCPVKEYDGYSMIGNNAIYEYDNGVETDTGEPFAIEFWEDEGVVYGYVYTADDSTEVSSLSISDMVEEVHQIDKKFVPMPDLADVAHTGDYYDLQNTPYIPWDTVRYATSQSLTDGNKQIARDNIGASSATNLLNGSSTSLRMLNTSETIGSGSVALGSSTKASGNYSQAMGAGSVSEGDYSQAEGYHTLASGEASHAEGNRTKATDSYSHAEGFNTGALSSGSHSEGLYTTASGIGSHAEGYSDYSNISLTGAANATTYTVSSFDLNYMKRGFRITILEPSTSSYMANGKSAYVTAINKTNNTITLNKTLSSTNLSNQSAVVFFGAANGKGSHTEGNGTVALSQYQHVQGKYNIEDSGNKYAHIVGNGTLNTSRSNAHTLDWNGNAWFAGNIYIGGTSQDDATAVKVAIVPFPTAADEGKILRVVNGAPKWVALPNAEEASF